MDWLVTLALAIAAVLVFQAEIAKPYRIPTPSMEPTLHCARPVSGCLAGQADRVIVNRLAYRFRDPRRGEIVVFTPPAAAGAACPPRTTFVKRIVGLPGETVSMRAGRVSVDGRRLAEPYVRSSAQRGARSGTWHVPAGSYFVLGDNRTRSCDSRAWGSVARDALVGPVVLTYWPPGRLP